MHIAIVRLTSLGDIVLSATVLPFIKKAFPDAIIDWVVDADFMQLLENSPYVNNVIPLELRKNKKQKNIGAFFKEFKKLKELPRYDIIIDMQGLLKSAFVALSMKGKRYGYSFKSAREGLAALTYSKCFYVPYHMNTVMRNAALVEKILRITIKKEDVIHKPPLFGCSKKNTTFAPFLDDSKKNILFIIGSTWASRNYPKEKWVEIANILKEQCLVLWFTEDEYKAASYIAEHSPYVKIVPKGDLNNLKALIAEVDLVIGGDTGPTHLAWAMNTPSLVLFGPTPADRMLKTPINDFLKSESSVNPYKLDKCDNSLQTISVSAIIAKARALLN